MKVQFNYPIISGKRYTIAMVKIFPIKEIQEGESTTALIGRSICYFGDRFVKKIGRDVAFGRLEACDMECVFKEGDTTRFFCKHLNLMFLFKNEHLFKVTLPNFFV